MCHPEWNFEREPDGNFRDDDACRQGRQYDTSDNIPY